MLPYLIKIQYSVGSPGQEVTNFNIFLLSIQQDKTILIKEKHTLPFTVNLYTCRDDTWLRVVTQGNMYLALAFTSLNLSSASSFISSVPGYYQQIRFMSSNPVKHSNENSIKKKKKGNRLLLPLIYLVVSSQWSL